MSILRLFLHDPARPLLFNSGTFFLFFTLFVAGYMTLLDRRRLRIVYVLLFSAFYYYKCNGIFALALLFTACSDYLLARLIYRASSRRAKRWLTAFSISLSLGILGYFKYTGFALASFAALTGSKAAPFAVFLPIGISFYTFQSISYVVDVYRERYVPRESFVEYAFYLSFFPQIVAGPIVRAEDLLPQMRRAPSISAADMRAGLFLLLRGLAKKAVIADFIGIYCDLIYANPAGHAGPEVALAVYGYALQIYFDFSGYSDMAVGMARVIGFELPENFRAPYLARNISEFWQRWHISLSTWLRDYLYISLGGNRCKPWRRNVNLVLTMLLGGLWHGAAWTFVAWGGLHGAALVLHKWYATKSRDTPHGDGAGRSHGRIKQALAQIATFHFVAACWVLFRAPSFGRAAAILAQLTSDWRGSTVLAVISARRMELFAVMLAALLCILPASLNRWSMAKFAQLPLLLRAGALLVVMQLIVQLRFTNVQPFIYFQF